MRPPILREVFKKVKSFFSRQKQTFSKNSFFPAVILEWNNLDVNIRNSASCNFLRELYQNLLDLNPIKYLMLTVVKG